MIDLALTYFLYIIFGVLPSIIWLLFYLREDVHPEPNSMVIKVFLWGMLATLPAVLIEWGFSESIFFWFKNLSSQSLLYFILVVALTEETMKYLVVRDKVLKTSEIDEPTDIILYCIIAALGFAALENVFYLFFFQLSFSKAVLISSFRFLGAIFLHALCSGALGYFLALSFYQAKKKFFLFSLGLSLAILLHGLFNFFIIKMGEAVIEKNGVVSMVAGKALIFYSIGLLGILVGLAIFVSLGFKKLKKLQSICKIV